MLIGIDYLFGHQACSIQSCLYLFLFSKQAFFRVCKFYRLACSSSVATYSAIGGYSIRSSIVRLDDPQVERVFRPTSYSGWGRNFLERERRMNEVGI